MPEASHASNISLFPVTQPNYLRLVLDHSLLSRAAIILCILLGASLTPPIASRLNQDTQFSEATEDSRTVGPWEFRRNEGGRSQEVRTSPILLGRSGLVVTVPVGETRFAEFNWSFVATKLANQSRIDYFTSMNLPEHMFFQTINFTVRPSSECPREVELSDICYNALALFAVESDPAIDEGVYNVQVIYDLFYYLTCCVPAPERIFLQNLDLHFVAKVIPSTIPFVTSLELNVIPANSLLGETVRVEGKLAVEKNQTHMFSLTKANVTLNYLMPNGLTITSRVLAENGSFAQSFLPDIEGKWQVFASWEGDLSRMSSSSKSQRFIVTAPSPPYGLILVAGGVIFFLYVVLYRSLRSRGHTNKASEAATCSAVG